MKVMEYHAFVQIIFLRWMQRQVLSTGRTHMHSQQLLGGDSLYESKQLQNSMRNGQSMITWIRN